MARRRRSVLRALTHRALRRWWKGIVGAAIAIALLQGTLIRQVRWEGDAPIGWETIAEVNKRLRWRPLWWATPQRLQGWLKGELVGQVQVRWRFPNTVIIFAQPPRLVGVLPKGERGVLVDAQGRRWQTVPLTTTHYPLLWLPEKVPLRSCLAAVRQTLRMCARQKVAVRAISVSPFGEVALCLPDGDWLKLGNPFALHAKMRLGLAARRQFAPQSPSVLDLSGMAVIGVRQRPSR
jgi:cell division septal protein FtsQ